MFCLLRANHRFTATALDNPNTTSIDRQPPHWHGHRQPPRLQQRLHHRDRDVELATHRSFTEKCHKIMRESASPLYDRVRNLTALRLSTLAWTTCIEACRSSFHYLILLSDGSLLHRVPIESFRCFGCDNQRLCKLRDCQIFHHQSEVI